MDKAFAVPRLRLDRQSEVWNLIWAPMRTRVLAAALELNVFEVLGKAPVSAKQVAGKIKADERATRMLLDELAALNLILKKAGKYSSTTEADTFFKTSSPFCVRGMFINSPVQQQSWDALADVIRKGKSPIHVDETPQGEEFFQRLVAQIYPTSFIASSRLLKYIDLPNTPGTRILDVAAGSAAWSLPFALKYKKARVTALDLPMVLKVTKDFVKRHGVSDRYDYLQGNLREIDFGQNQYDLIILGHICHSEGAEWSRKLIAKCGKALKPGGTLAIPDMVPDENRTAPEFDVLFALNMLLHTNQGDTFTLEEYKKWLKAARLDKVQLLRSDKIGCDVVIARKPAK